MITIFRSESRTLLKRRRRSVKVSEFSFKIVDAKRAHTHTRRGMGRRSRSCVWPVAIHRAHCLSHTMQRCRVRVRKTIHLHVHTWTRYVGVVTEEITFKAWSVLITNNYVRRTYAREKKTILILDTVTFYAHFRLIQFLSTYCPWSNVPSGVCVKTNWKIVDIEWHRQSWKRRAHRKKKLKRKLNASRLRGNRRGKTGECLRNENRQR